MSSELLDLGLVFRYVDLFNLTFYSYTFHFQEMTSRFIDRLSNEYSEYIDITEPIQVAIYEMKLGLSLIVSGVLCKRYLPNGEQNMESVLVGRRSLFLLIVLFILRSSLPLTLVVPLTEHN